MIADEEPTMRDVFAFAALIGMGTWCPTRAHEPAGMIGPPINEKERREWQADYAFKLADAMIAARGEGQ